MSSAERPARGRRGRISRSRDFDAVYRRGRSAAGRHLDAVTRNRVKRVVREEFARVAATVPARLDVVVIARAGCAAYVDEHGSAALGARLGELLARAISATAPEPRQPDVA
jgi:ribonuclease P protein component